MPDIIKLLPDTIANQIAAGEVIQRPASVVKELLENAIDAGSTRVHLSVKDAGKTLIMVTDNGRGMSETDARMSLERHATSKINSADDLFAIKTMGFRGEALASIAAISQMEIKTKPEKFELATLLRVVGGKVEEQLPVSGNKGTQISVKNLFFNVPARRKFLKSEQVELRHIIDEFERVALANPEVKFEFEHNGNELFNLPKANLRQRLINVFGRKYNEKLVPVEQETTVVNIRGYALRPEAARKTRGEQFFFVNNRFIKSGFLHMMVARAYDELIPAGFHPGYFLFLDLDPSFIDINIHPTKTEIKFEDERTVGALLNSAVKQAIGMFNVSPTIDFDQETSFDVPPLPKGKIPDMPPISYNPDFNPFTQGQGIESKPSKAAIEGMRDFYGNPETEGSAKATPNEIFSGNEADSTVSNVMQVNRKYIFSTIRSGVLVIYQSRAHQRVLYDEFMATPNGQAAHSQQLLFPETANYSPADFALIQSLSTALQQLGFDLSEFGKNSMVIRGIPAVASGGEGSKLLTDVLDQYRQLMAKPNLEKHQALALSLARKAAIKTGQTLGQEELKNLIDQLFSCQNPASLPDGRRIFYTLSLDELNNRFK